MLMLELMDSVPFFDSFTLAEKKYFIEADSFFVHFEPGGYLIREGDVEDSSLYILVRGEVLVTRNSHPDHPLARLRAGAVLGEISFLTHRPRMTNVRALTKTIAFRLDGHSLERMSLPLQVRIKDQLITILVKRLDEMNLAMLSMVR
ncbi:MAG: cyclic nucleotide-binding domain-containing protein [Magnetococcales bacterium]|nr:cyclic nucleotide-binding domain-containing protein [Magnetococcales bacterium]